jgi:serine/threonine protein kinase/Tfp pilus assembly protein PilF
MKVEDSLSTGLAGSDAAADAELAKVLEAYFAALEVGRAPDREKIVADHPAIADRLRSCLASLHLVEREGGMFQAAGIDEEGEPLDGEKGKRCLGDFRIVKEVGRGGMGVVYEAEQISLGRRVALKVLPFAATMDSRNLQRFQNEARAAACLHHENIVPVHGVGSDCGVHYYAMQFIEGRTLAALIAEHRHEPEAQPAQQPTQTFPATALAAETAIRAKDATVAAPRDLAHFRRVAEWGVRAAEALEHAHGLGIVHRDIKPANLMIDRQGKLWITDFGLARTATDTGLTMTGDVLGTLRYMSPEQALAKHGLVDHRTDIYSLGATLYEWLTLRPAVDGKNREEILKRITFEEPRPPRWHSREIPPDLETIVQKAMAKEQGERYVTAQEMADDLGRFMEDKPIKAKRRPLRHRILKWGRRHKPVVWCGATVILAAMLLCGTFYWKKAAEFAAIERSALRDLEQAELWEQEEIWPGALAALDRATARLEGSGLTELEQRTQRMRDEVTMAAELEEVRLQSSAHDLRDAEADKAYATVFAEHNLDISSAGTDEAAARIRVSGIRVRLVAALDHWAEIKDRLENGSGESVRAISRLADEDLWRQQLRDPTVRDNRAALEELAGKRATVEQPPSNIEFLTRTLKRAGARDAGEQLLRLAQRRHPNDFWINHELAELLYFKAPDDRGEVIGYFRAALALRPQSASVHEHLGVALLNQGYFPDAVEAFRKAIDIKQDKVSAHVNLAVGLTKQGKLPEAIQACRKAIELAPGDGDGYFCLGNALNDEGKLPEAVKAYEKSIELHVKDMPGAYNNLGNALHAQGEETAAIEAYEMAKTFSRWPALYVNLGKALRDQGQLQNALDAFEWAINKDPNFAVAHCQQAEVFRRQGRLEDALKSLKRADQLGSQQREWRWPTAVWIANVEYLIRLEAMLPSVRAGLTQPKSATDRVHFAEICLSHRFVRAAFRLYSQAFTDNPSLVDQPAHGDDPGVSLRYHAACAGVLASGGEGDDANSLDDLDPIALRQHALAWLRADLDRWRALLDSDLNKSPDKAGPAVLRTMRHWQEDADLAGVRTKERLAELAESEREHWEKLWADVEELRQRAYERIK